MTVVHYCNYDFGFLSLLIHAFLIPRFIGGTLSKWMAPEHVHARGASVYSAYVCMDLCDDDTGMLSLLLDQI